jgi:hypothetical protein
MIPMLIPLLETTDAVSNFWSIFITVISSAVTAGIITLISKALDRPKTIAEEDKLKVEAKKVKVETDNLQNEETWRLYKEVKEQYANLKKESDEQIATLKKESGEQMDFLKKQISLHSDTLELQGANFEEQEKTIQKLQSELQTEKTARLKLETIIKKFQQWAVRNQTQLEAAKIEPVPVELYL